MHLGRGLVISQAIFPCELELCSRVWSELEIDLKSGLDVKVLGPGKRYSSLCESRCLRVGKCNF